MTGHDVSGLTGGDVTAALASFPRRYRAALVVEPDEDLEELAGRVGPDGRSAHDLVLDAVSSLVVIGRALHQVVHEDRPLLHPAVADPSARTWAPPAGMSTTDLVDLLDEECAELARLGGDLRAGDWDRTGRVADGPEVTALGLAREAVRTAADDLRGVEAALRSARAA
jgi:hypothetical protein